MPIDPSIPLQFRLPQIQGPLDQAVQAAQLQQLFDQSALSKLNREQAVRAQQAGTLNAERDSAMRAEIEALPPEQRTRENVLPILLKYAGGAKEMAGMLPEAPKPQSIGAGGLRLPDGTIVPPVEKPPSGPEIVQLQRFLETLPPNSPARKDIEARIEKLTRDTPAVNVYSGSLVAGVDDAGNPVFVQPSGREGVAPRVVHGVRPKPDKAPPGFRPTADGGMEPIPGGPADLKAQGVFNQDKATLEGTTSGMDRLAVAANELKRHPGLPRITGLSGALPDIPGSAAADARAKLQTLKAQTGFAVLQDMRNASKTGGALGQITERELAFLQNALAALETAQSEAQIKESLDKIIQFTEESKGRLRNAFNTKHSERTGEAPAAPTQQYREGQTATGPGGQKIIFKNGQWQPVSPQGSR